MASATTASAVTTKNSPAKSRRRWYQFSLRTLLIAMLVLSAGFGEIGRRIYQAREQAAKVAALRALGISAMYDTQPVKDGESGVSYWRSLPQRQIHKWLGIDYAYRVHEIRAHGPPPASSHERDEFWRLAASFPELTRLSVGPEWCDSSGLARLRGKTTLRELTLYARQPTNEDMELIGTLTNLQRLFFMIGGKRPSLMDDRGFAHLDRLKDLRDLALGEVGITDASLPHLAKHPRLKSLSLSSTSITDEGLVHLAAVPYVEYLNLSRTRISDDGLRHLKAVSNLASLTLYETNVRGPGLEHLQALKNLTHLSMDTRNIDDRNLKQFESLNHLREIRLDESQITDAGLKKFHPPADVYSISFFHTSITDAGLMSLAKYPQIEVLNVSNTRVTPEGKAAFQKAVPQCQFR